MTEDENGCCLVGLLFIAPAIGYLNHSGAIGCLTFGIGIVVLALLNPIMGRIRGE